MDLHQKRLLGILTNTLCAGPDVIDLEITSACNLSCQFCPFHSCLSKQRRSIVHMPFEKIKHILDTAHFWKSRELIISADGEPTLHPHFKDIIAYAHAKKLFIIMTTNGVFSKDLLPTIAHIQQIDINISASTQELYTQLQSPTNPHTFKTLLYNLKFLTTLSKKHLYPKVNIVFVINALNINAIENIFLFAQQHDISKIFFQPMVPRKETHQIALSPQQKKYLLLNIPNIIKKYPKTTHNLESIIPQLSLPEFDTNTPCYEGWYNIYINRFLRVSLCCHNQRLHCGNIQNHSLQSIWESEKAQHLRTICQHRFNVKNSFFKNICFWCLSRKEHLKIHQHLQNFPLKHLP